MSRVMSRKLATNDGLHVVIDRPSCRNVVWSFFLILSILGPLACLIIIKPSSLYNPSSPGGTNILILLRIYIPTSSHNSAPSYKPIGTSKVVFFLVQVSPFGPIKENIYTYNNTSKIPKFRINDLVRISLKRRDLFDKPSSNIKWSEELFKIHSINRSNVITYKIKDLNDEIIEGIFYQQELQKSKNTSEVYIIEKIIRKNKNKYLVK